MNPNPYAKSSQDDPYKTIQALQATVQEQAAEIERLKVEADPDALHIAFLHGQGNANDLRKLIAHQHKELTDSQHKVKVLTDALWGVKTYLDRQQQDWLMEALATVKDGK